VVSIPSTPEQLRPSREELGTAILEALAQVRAAPVGELRDEMTASGTDLEMDSREAEAVIAILEHRYGQELVLVEDLEPERLASVGSLAELIHQRWPAGQPLTASRAR
jgi:acyl carrier protein